MSSNEKTIKTRIIHKHDTETNWEKAVNFIPKNGELIIYDADSNNKFPRFKVGDGVTLINDLSFTIDVDQVYNPNSISPQSGIAVNEAIHSYDPQQIILGNPINANDVSPLEHNLDIKVTAETEIDLSTVKISRYGKNLINQAELCKAYTEVENGVYSSNFSNICLNETNKVRIPLKDYIGKVLVFSFKTKVSASGIRPCVTINNTNFYGDYVLYRSYSWYSCYNHSR